jgi:hypothetical protein
MVYRQGEGSDKDLRPLILMGGVEEEREEEVPGFAGERTCTPESSCYSDMV